MDSQVNVVCLKWGDKYPAEYVNRLYRMLNKHLSIPFVFHCMTDNSDGLYEEINILPLELDESLKGWWYKLMVFKEDFYGLKGKCLFIDLDVVIVNNIDGLFEGEDDFYIIKDLQEGAVYNSSVFRLDLGSMSYVWESFLADKENIVNSMHGDQDWISRSVKDATLWPKGSVVSFKKECAARTKRSFGRPGQFLRKLGFLIPKGEAMYPETAKIVYFHGKPDPHDVAEGPYDMWKAAPWIKSEWDAKR